MNILLWSLVAVQTLLLAYIAIVVYNKARKLSEHILEKRGYEEKCRKRTQEIIAKNDEYIKLSTEVVSLKKMIQSKKSQLEKIKEKQDD